MVNTPVNVITEHVNPLLLPRFDSHSLELGIMYPEQKQKSSLQIIVMQHKMGAVFAVKPKIKHKS